MIWLYRLQQRLSITRREGLALVTLTLLFVTGLGVQHIRNQQVPPVAADSVVATSPARTGASTSEEAGAENEPAAPTPENPLDLNSASTDALQTLTGIGPALAERIVDYRRTQRPFQRVDELRRVRGIGDKTLADIRSRIQVEASTGS